MTRELYAGRGWREAPADSTEMFEAFLTVRRLHQMLWCLTEAASLFLWRNREIYQYL